MVKKKEQSDNLFLINFVFIKFKTKKFPIQLNEPGIIYVKKKNLKLVRCYLQLRKAPILVKTPLKNSDNS